MPPVTNPMLNKRKEKDVVAYTPERKYYHCIAENTWVKRSLRPKEWQHSANGMKLVIPQFGMERILNEGACLKFIADNTDIPVPKLYATFEDDEAAYVITEYIDGVVMADLDAEGQATVTEELKRHLETLSKLKSRIWGGPSGLVVPPWRLMAKSLVTEYIMRPRNEDSLVFCHGDLSQHNIIVDPKTHKILAIIDWEYAGFYPATFEGHFYKRPGPSLALEDEEDDRDELMVVLRAEQTVQTTW